LEKVKKSIPIKKSMPGLIKRIIKLYLFHIIRKSRLKVPLIKKSSATKTLSGLFKNAQMQGAQEPYREAYYTYVERCGLQRNAAD